MNIKSEKEIYGEELERVSVADKFKGKFKGFIDLNC